MMAAAACREMVGVGESSSSDEEEVLRRCQEAVWENKPDTKKDGDTSVQQSKRVVVADHEHDGNELQVTAGFRTHVAKKLGNLLDSFITETETSSCVETKCDDDDDEGFRLFSTSVPGQAAAVDLPAPPRRRPVPSSSDSDSEMETRLKEAAVSIKDLLPSLSSTLPTPVAEPPHSEVTKKKKKKKKKKPAEEEESAVAEKTKKRKPDEEDSVGSPKAQINGEQQHVRVKVKKKKRREGNSEEETLN
ncbi:protein CUSTOS [Morone saxatilis]|uniref:protein CUSTOS n=1 Tax=Morone saxatilis TaxID=34816 RepID=UPI0015E233B3|nr:protein CUSTOS [Morone saxatilis]